MGEAVHALGLRPVSESALVDHFRTAAAQVKHRRFASAPKRARFMMGVLMKRMSGSMEGKHVAARLTEWLDQSLAQPAPAETH